MAGYAIVSREEAGKQQNEILEPQRAPGASEPPKNAQPGSRPDVPVESDPEAIAAYQGALGRQLEDEGSWHLNAWNKPVWVPGRGAQGGGGRAVARDSGEPLEIPPKAEEREKPAAPKRG